MLLVFSGSDASAAFRLSETAKAAIARRAVFMSLLRRHNAALRPGFDYGRHTANAPIKSLQSGY
ncbi:hypothetical protein LMG27198_51470 [Methylocystis echinoides]|uniref:Uncharacterized protein n=1 Tax=Methylocystis echinoides TaxID=29468 RepID=A0A9W6H0C5_9HYPH|nr:hypothetical protein LMG27198_51470 [Methylocystis echinoides]